MPTMATVFGILVAIAPMAVITACNFRRWRRHYGMDHTIIGYYFRYLTNKRATDDWWPVFMLKASAWLIWFMACLQLFIV